MRSPWHEVIEDISEYDFHMSQEEDLAKDAYQDGKLAYSLVGATINPHPIGSMEYRFWNEGWTYERNRSAI